MKKDLRTMEEKQKLDPNEMMENGMTRQQNEEADKAGAGVSLVLVAISVCLSLYSLSMLF